MQNSNTIDASFINELSPGEREAVKHLQQVKYEDFMGIFIRSAFIEPTAAKFRELIYNLVQAYRDDRVVLGKMLGFDLLTVMNMKLYTEKEVNGFIAGLGYPYRLVEQLRYTHEDSLWLSRSGMFNMAETEAIVWLDNNLIRYIRLSNGQIFRCSSTDLTTLPELDKINLRAILTGVID